MSKHAKILRAIKRRPVLANIRWADVVSALTHLGVNVRGMGGSVFSLSRDGVTVTVHRPHPGDECKRPLVRDIQDFLGSIGE